MVCDLQRYKVVNLPSSRNTNHVVSDGAQAIEGLITIKACMTNRELLAEIRQQSLDIFQVIDVGEKETEVLRHVLYVSRQGQKLAEWKTYCSIDLDSCVSNKL